MIYASHGCIRRYELADRLNYSGEYLSRIMKKYTGYTLKAYCHKIQMQEAARLLSSTRLPVTQIAYALDMKTEPSSITISKKNFT